MNECTNLPYSSSQAFMFSNALLNLAPQLLAPLGNSLPYIWACYPSLVGTETSDVCEGEGGFRDREVVNQLSEKKLL